MIPPTFEKLVGIINFSDEIVGIKQLDAKTEALLTKLDWIGTCHHNENQPQDQKGEKSAI